MKSLTELTSPWKKASGVFMPFCQGLNCHRFWDVMLRDDIQLHPHPEPENLMQSE